jgi:tRNA threonylcarbamoyladenosine biosynthesis protein TsaE
MSANDVRSLRTQSADETRSLGDALGTAIAMQSRRAAIVVGLNGDLGVGKTTFVSGLLRRLGIVGPVRSPTYTLIEPYELNDRSIFHLDLYRLASPRELEMLAIRDLLQPNALLLVEWAERGGAELPPRDLEIDLRYIDGDDQSRAIQFVPKTTEGKELADCIQAIANEKPVSP